MKAEVGVSFDSLFMHQSVQSPNFESIGVNFSCLIAAMGEQACINGWPGSPKRGPLLFSFIIINIIILAL